MNKNTDVPTVRYWVRWVVGVIVAVSITLFIGNYISRDNLVDGCLRGSEFKNVNALAWEEASRARRSDGDTETAQFYDSVAESIRKTIPVSEDNVSLLRGATKAERAEGCDSAYPPLLPFVE